MDKTRPEGGWANVLLWLDNHPPDARVQRYFAGGLFAGALSSEPLDAILIHLDSDSIEDKSFREFVLKRYKYELDLSREPDKKAAHIRRVISLAAQLQALTAADAGRHLPAPAVEATETWCVAAFRSRTEDFEALRGEALIDAFMAALERSEGRPPQQHYANIDKSLGRRARFCEKHASGSPRIIRGCKQFAVALDELVALAP
jgi:hypothetical protein